MGEFKISQSSTSFLDRPSISYLVREYLEKFTLENLLIKKGIIITSKWNIDLVVVFCKETHRYKSDYLYMTQKPRMVASEGIKIYEILIPLKLIHTSTKVYLKYYRTNV